MADELTVTLLLDYARGTLAMLKELRGVQIDVAASPYHHTIQSVSTTQEALSLGDITPGGFLFLFNHDPNNFVELRGATGTVDVVRVKPGEMAFFRLSPDATAPFVIADTAAVNLEVLLFSA